MKRQLSNSNSFSATSLGPRGRAARRSLVLSPALAFLALLALSVPAHAVVPIPVSTCRTIASPGLYEATGPIATISKFDCIRISASNVTFNVDSLISGPGASVSAGAGIHILPGATNVFVENFTVEGFKIGVLDEGSWATVNDFEARFNSTAGVFLNGVNEHAHAVLRPQQWLLRRLPH